MPQSHIQEQIELIAKHEQDFLAQRTRAERLIDAVAGFIGSLIFVAAHLTIFAAWIVFNLLPNTRHFDPKPFGLLQTLVAMEAILAASFILMRQTRIGRRSDERDHLMLQILLLTEKELTALLTMDRQIATEMGLSRVANTQDVRELSKQTSIDEVAQTIKDTLP
jgi:uncharacterized membrane protein